LYRCNEGVISQLLLLEEHYARVLSGKIWKIQDETKRRPGNQETGKGTRKSEHLGKAMPNTRSKPS
jgi:hypothetical protein